MTPFSSNHLKHLLLNSAAVRAMPDLIETMPNVDDYFMRLEQAAIDCEEREIMSGGCEGCESRRARYCWRLWNKICELSAAGRLRWIQQGDAWHYDDEEVRHVVSEFLKVTKADSRELKQPMDETGADLYFTQLTDVVVQLRDGRYKLR